jgi:hypothetical protein
MAATAPGLASARQAASAMAEPAVALAPKAETLKPPAVVVSPQVEAERRKATALQQQALDTAQTQTRTVSIIALLASVLLGVETVLLIVGALWFRRVVKKAQARTRVLIEALTSIADGAVGTDQAQSLTRLEGRLDDLAATVAERVAALDADGPAASSGAWWRDARAGLIEDIVAMLPGTEAGQPFPVRSTAEDDMAEGELPAVRAFLRAFDAPHEPFRRALHAAAGSGFVARLEGAERLAATLFIASESLMAHDDPYARRASFDTLLADLGLADYRAVIGEVGARAGLDPAAFYYAESLVSDTIARTLWPGIRRADGAIVLKSHVRVH